MATDPSTESLDITSFSVGDLHIRRGCIELCKLLQSQGSFTDTSRFTLRCDQCQAPLVGQQDAVKHAKSTGHTDFVEYKG